MAGSIVQPVQGVTLGACCSQLFQALVCRIREYAVSVQYGMQGTALLCLCSGAQPARFMMVCPLMFSDAPEEKWENWEKGGKWGKMGGNSGATGPWHPGMAWVGTRSACNPLNHWWWCHTLPETLCCRRLS